MEFKKVKNASKLVVLIAAMFLSFPTLATSEWTGYAQVGSIRSYTDPGYLQIYLSGHSCENSKPYFLIHSTEAPNGTELISLVLAARMAKVSIRIYFDPDIDSTHCYVKGVQLEG